MRRRGDRQPSSDNRLRRSQVNKRDRGPIGRDREP